MTSRPQRAWLLFLLGLLSMLPALSIDTSLPGLPEIAGALGARPGAMQWTIAAFVAAYGPGQLALGPLSDRYGRRPVLLAGMAAFTAAGIACAAVHDVGTLIAMRLIQGFGGGAGMVVGRAIIQDISRDDRAGATVRQAVVSAMNGIAPLVAPALGVVILKTLGWPWLYLSLAVFGAVLFAMVAATLPETSERVTHSVADAYARVLRLPRTAGIMVLVFGGFFAFFAMISGSPLILIGQLHESPAAFALAFAVAAAALIAGTTITGQFVRRFAPEPLFATSAALVPIAALACFLADTFDPTVTGFVATWAFYAFVWGMTTPNAFAAALAGARKDAGLTAGIIGATLMAGGAAGGAIAGALRAPPASATAIVTLVGGLGAGAGYLLSRRGLREERQRSEPVSDHRT